MVSAVDDGLVTLDRKRRKTREAWREEASVLTDVLGERGKMRSRSALILEAYVMSPQAPSVVRGIEAIFQRQHSPHDGIV